MTGEKRVPDKTDSAEVDEDTLKPVDDPDPPAVSIQLSNQRMTLQKMRSTPAHSLWPKPRSAPSQACEARPSPTESVNRSRVPPSLPPSPFPIPPHPYHPATRTPDLAIMR